MCLGLGVLERLGVVCVSDLGHKTFFVRSCRKKYSTVAVLFNLPVNPIHGLKFLCHKPTPLSTKGYQAHFILSTGVIEEKSPQLCLVAHALADRQNAKSRVWLLYTLLLKNTIWN